MLRQTPILAGCPTSIAYILHTYTKHTQHTQMHTQHTNTYLHSAGSLGKLEYPSSYVLVTRRRLHHVTQVKVWAPKVPPGLSPAVDRHRHTTLHTHT